MNDYESRNGLSGLPRAEAGVYCILIGVDRDLKIRVGKLGFRTFPRGTYVYTGRARRHLLSRVARHMRRRKRKRWHIDYLLAHAAARPIGVILFVGEDVRECDVNREVVMRADDRVPGFGASDCSNRCRSHLAYFAPGDA